MTVTQDHRTAARHPGGGAAGRPQAQTAAAARAKRPGPARLDAPAGGAWRQGAPSGRRRFATVGTLALERGARLAEVTLAYETWGRLAPARDNVVLVEHALTGDSHVAGPAEAGHPTPGWWDGVVGPGRAIDTNEWFVVAVNVLGGCQGSTGPSSPAPDGRPWGSRFPDVTIRDQVAAEELLLRHLGIDRVAAVVGGSMGGMRALEWAVTHPDRVDRCLVVASSAYATADQIAWAQPQLLAIRNDPDFAGGDYYDTGREPAAGLGLARRIAHITYRTEHELDARFGREHQRGENPLAATPGPVRGRYAVEGYLDHHADKLARRFDANSYVLLTEAMNSHDVGRGRGGVEAALASVRAATTVVSVDSDRLYPPRLSAEIAAHVPGARHDQVTSPYGHDAFLIELDRVGEILRAALAREGSA